MSKGNARAAAVTVLGLVGLAVLALSAGRQQTADVASVRPLVRTKVIHRTIHVTKHAKPKHPAVGGSGPAVGPGAAGTASAGAAVTTGSSSLGSTETASAPVTTSTSGAAAAPAGEEAAPVTTATSGGGGGVGGTGGGEGEDGGRDD